MMCESNSAGDEYITTEEDEIAKKMKKEPDESETPEAELFNNVDIERSTNNRIKVYIHNGAERIWEDMGTGHVGSFTKENQHYIHFRWECEDTKYCNWKIKEGMHFTKQQDTLIIFTPIDAHNETALSFQSKDGADLFWKNICELTGRNLEDINIEEDGEESVHASDDEGLEDGAGQITIPPLKMVALPEIENVCAIAQKSPVITGKLIETIQKDNWLDKLKKLHEMTSDLEDTFSLVSISRIIRNLIMLNNEYIIAFLFDNSNLKTVLQLLSHIPNEAAPIDHAEFLYNTAKWQQVFRIQNKGTIEAIERAYRIQYLVDVCLPPKLSAAIAVDDNWASAADNYLNRLRTQILTNIIAEEQFENDVITALSSTNTNTKHRRNLIRFLHELIEMADHFAAASPTKKKIFETLFNMDVIRIVKPCLISENYEIRKNTMDVILLISKFDVKEVLEFISDDCLSNSTTDSFLVNEVIKLITYDPDPEINLSAMVTQFLRQLMGPEDQPLDFVVQRQHFVGVFFKRSFRVLLQPVFDGVKDGKLCNDSYQASRKIALVIYFLGYCVRRHPVTTRIHIIPTGVLASIAILMSSKHAFLFMSAFKLIKTILLTKDDFFIRHLLSTNVLSTVISIFFDNYATCNNMYNSAYLDFFEYILKDDRKEILNYIRDKFGDKFEDLTYCKTFDSLKKGFKGLQYNMDLYNPDTPESLPDKEADFSDSDDNVPAPGPSLTVKDADFKPRLSPVRITEEDVFINRGQVRPPTPITKRIVMRISRRVTEDVQEPSVNSSPIVEDSLEPMRLVDYDDSDQESSDKEDSSGTATTKDTNESPLEQRGKKRKASLENEEDPDTVIQPKRLTTCNGP